MKISKRSKKLVRTPNKKRFLRKLLIVCEGTKTEPNYFRHFPENPEVYDILDIYGTGDNTLNIVKKAIELRDQAEDKGEPYIETWAVFDKDDFQHFEEAIRLAITSKIHCAYSIECFEIWYLLHFNYYDTVLSRNDYFKKLSQLLKQPYEKNNEKMYSLLIKRVKTAIKNASTLYSRQCNKPFSEQNPITLVFKLVQRLMVL